jgi:hypothetical protein
MLRLAAGIGRAATGDHRCVCSVMKALSTADFRLYAFGGSPRRPLFHP